MHVTQTVRCPNCGSQGKRHHFTSEEVAYSLCPGKLVLQTECPVCDYLMAICSRNGSVIEAHSPGTRIPCISLESTKIEQFLIPSFQ